MNFENKSQTRKSLTEQSKELIGDLGLIEWSLEGQLIHHQSDSKKKPVNFRKTAQENRDAYLSLRDLDDLINICSRDRQRYFKKHLTPDHFKIIRAYERKSLIAFRDRPEWLFRIHSIWRDCHDNFTHLPTRVKLIFGASLLTLMTGSCFTGWKLNQSQTEVSLTNPSSPITTVANQNQSANLIDFEDLNQSDSDNQYRKLILDLDQLNDFLFQANQSTPAVESTPNSTASELNFDFDFQSFLTDNPNLVNQFHQRDDYSSLNFKQYLSLQTQSEQLDNLIVDVKNQIAQNRTMVAGVVAPGNIVKPVSVAPAKPAVKPTPMVITKSPTVDSQIMSRQADKDKADSQAREIKPVNLSSEKVQLLEAAGIAQSDWKFVDYIFTRESNWTYNIWNRQGSSAFGLCQTMMGIWKNKYPLNTEEYKDFSENPVTQIRWCNWYAHQRYGSWEKAYNFWLNNKWW